MSLLKKIDVYATEIISHLPFVFDAENGKCGLFILSWKSQVNVDGYFSFSSEDNKTDFGKNTRSIFVITCNLQPICYKFYYFEISVTVEPFSFRTTLQAYVWSFTHFNWSLCYCYFELFFFSWKNTFSFSFDFSANKELQFHLARRKQLCQILYTVMMKAKKLFTPNFQFS